ncbi:MgtC/SapB family protein, partial [Pontibacterium sp.]|uniref:MgtC/SapB family protein n=1 Tax=Pontibacterium sp. TaxID=2036026 RepID=UPI0035684181
GLTTAASIWITAAIGILAGIGFYLPLLVSVILTISTLSIFRWIEEHLPSQAYYHFECRYARTSEMTEFTIRTLVEGCGFSIANLSYRLDEDGRQRRNRMVLRTTDRASAFRLSEMLEATESIHEFRITPTGD